MRKSIIATVYSFEPVIASVTKQGASELHLLIDHNPDSIQQKAIDSIKSALGDYVNIRTIRTKIYDIYEIAKTSVDLIDKLHNEGKDICLNISSARKTKALGLLYAGYARANKIGNIVYIVKETKEMIILPKIQFKLNKNQTQVLKHHLNSNQESSSHLDLNMPRSTYYKILQDLKSQGLIHESKITDAGRIVLL
ncbi:MAG: DUF6293 family protein [Candidatus Woesearchaeota archaeon]